MDERMRFSDYVKPPVSPGKYVVRASQKVTQPEAEEFVQEAEFDITSHVFVLPAEDVFSCYPSPEESGMFETVLPHIVMENRTFPWEHVIAEEQNGVPVPWVALIVLAEGEAQEHDLTVRELLSEKERPDGVYFPGRESLPSVYCEGEEDLCHVADVPREIFGQIMPSAADLPYLCHVKKVDLAKTEDSICEKDGFFSVVCGNRLIPSGSDTSVKSTVHLVSLLGYGDLGAVPDCDKIRLVSLYRWNVYSKKQSEEDFPSVIERLRKNCGVVGFDRDTKLRQEGYCVKEHNTRTGEMAYSLYRPPLIPFQNKEKLDTAERHTADGRLIYDRSVGILDVTYSAAWQLGRMATLSHPSVAGAIRQEREERKRKEHQERVNDVFKCRQHGMENVLSGMLERTCEKGDCHEKASVRGKKSDAEKPVPAVFRGYR